MKKHQHHHDIKITTPWTVFTFVVSLTLSFGSWLGFFVFIPIIYFWGSNGANSSSIPSESGFSGNEFSVFVQSFLLILIVLVIYLYLNYRLLGTICFKAVDEFKLLLSSKIIRLEKHQIKFIPTIKFFQIPPIKLPPNLIELKVVEKDIKYQPVCLIKLSFISQNTAPLTFFNTRDKSLAKRLDQEIANFYQVKFTENFQAQNDNWE
jgi:hypothetical protein